MPLLVMPTYEHTLLDQTYRAAVRRQIEYGEQRGVPWGISESGYNTFDAALNYQYRAFGVPGLGLARGLADELVDRAVCFRARAHGRPAGGVRNLQRLAARALQGDYGFYEAVDYTPARVPRGQSSAVVRSFMAHHQGMTLLSLAYRAARSPDAEALRALPEFQATLLLLQERVPEAAAPYLHHAAIAGSRGAPSVPQMPVRVLPTPDTATPEVQLLSNGRYHVMVTNAGGGYSRWKDLAVTRWREDPTRDNWGSFCYVRDVASGVFWSTAHQPTLARADALRGDVLGRRASSSAAATSTTTRDWRSSFRPRTTSSCAACTSPTARGSRVDRRHELRRSRARARGRGRPASGVQQSFRADGNLDASDTRSCARAGRARSMSACRGCFTAWRCTGTRAARVVRNRPLALHRPRATLASPARDARRGAFRHRRLGARSDRRDPLSASRSRPTNRRRSTWSPARRDARGVSRARQQISKTAGSRTGSSIWHGRTARSRCARSTPRSPMRSFTAASRARSCTRTRRCAPMRARSSRNRRGQSGLWGYAISGDLPIVLLQIGDLANIDLVRQLVQAHAYWRLKGLAVDLVIWNEDRAGYRQLLQDRIMGLIAAGVEAHVIDRPGRHLRPARRPHLGGGPPAAPGGRARHHLRPARARLPSRSSSTGAAMRACRAPRR